MEMRDATVKRPLERGDVLRLRSRGPTGGWRTREQVWTVENILPMVFHLGGPGIRVARGDRKMWIKFPEDPSFEIIERLYN